MRTFFVAAALAALLAAAAPFPDTPESLLAPLTERSISAHLTLIGSALLDGRLPGAQGESISAEYIASQLAEEGVSPAGDDGTYYQRVPFTQVTPVSTGTLDLVAAKATLSLRWFDDYVGSTQTTLASISLAGEEMAFVGYGITDAAHGWDDYKGANVTGKVVVVLVSQPTTGPWAGQPLSYSARSSYKYSEAARRGAKGVVLVHTLETASYPWDVVQNSNSGARTLDPTQLPATPLTFTGWMRSESADALSRLCGGAGLADWFARAELADFRPVQLCTRAVLESSYRYESVMGTSVVGVVRGASAPKEAVVLSAHIDHLGKRPLDGAVYAGTLDNGSGAAIVLSMAIAFARSGVRPARSVVFLFPTGEEAGLLGASYFVRQMPSELQGVRVVANVNYDISNAWGSALDVGVIGIDESTLGSEVMPWAASGEGMSASPDPTPLAAGFLYRGDQYAFLKAGIPGVWVFTGAKFAGKPADYFKKVVWDGYFCSCYHHPCDSWTGQTIEFAGMVQHARVGMRATYAIAASDYVPKMLK